MTLDLCDFWPHFSWDRLRGKLDKYYTTQTCQGNAYLFGVERV